MSFGRGRLALPLSPFALFAALALSPDARAQAYVDLFQIDGQNTLTGDQGFNRASCESGDSVQFFLRLRGLEQPAYQLRLVQYDVGGPQAPCPADMLEPVRAEVVAPFPVVPIGDEYTLDRTFTVVDFLGADACTDVGARANVSVCFQLTVLPGDRQAVLVGGIQLDYDTTAPPAVDLEDVTVTSGPSELSFEVPLPSGGNDAYELIAEYRLCPATDEDAADAGPDAGTADGDGEDVDPDSLCGAPPGFATARSEEAGRVTITGLSSGQDVEVRLSLVDDFDNPGPPSPLGVYRTSVGVGPLSLYDGAGSDMSCAASCKDLTSAAAGLGGLLCLLSRRSRRAWRALANGGRRVVGGVTLGVLSLAASSSAWAFTGQTTVGMSVAPYTPSIDDERVGGRPVFPIYGCMFGDNSALEFGGDFDTHVFDDFGSLQLSMGLGISQAQGKAQPDIGTTCAEPTDLDVQLSMLKVRPGITYRLDPLLDWLGFPVVPYGRLGLVVQGYAFTFDGDFDQGNVDPVGLRTGWEAAGGLMLALDFLDSLDPFVPDTTRRARANGVFDHTFLFVEGAHQVVDSFDQPGFIFSPKDVIFDTGMPILWRIGVAVELL